MSSAMNVGGHRFSVDRQLLGHMVQKSVDLLGKSIRLELSLSM